VQAVLALLQQPFQADPGTPSILVFSYLYFMYVMCCIFCVLCMLCIYNISSPVSSHLVNRHCGPLHLQPSSQLHYPTQTDFSLSSIPSLSVCGSAWCAGGAVVALLCRLPGMGRQPPLHLIFVSHWAPKVEGIGRSAAGRG
jgi:hypothetical protein